MGNGNKGLELHIACESVRGESPWQGGLSQAACLSQLSLY